MRKLSRYALVILASCAVVVPVGGAASAPVGGFVGLSGDVAVGVMLDRSAVLAYVCNGHSIGRWFRGARGGGSTVRITSGADRLTLTVRPSTVRAVLRVGATSRSVTLQPVVGRAGLYRSETSRKGVSRVAGWVVLRSGKQIGTVAVGTTLTPAPRLSTASLVAGSGAAAVVASQVISVDVTRLMTVDMRLDGFGVPRKVSTDLGGGGLRSIDWTVAGDDDAFVALDTAQLRAAGYRVADATGSPVGALVLVRSGLQITAPSGTTTTTIDGLQALRVLDKNGDGLLDIQDKSLSAIRLFNDLNGDGKPGEGEISNITDGLKGALEQLGDTPSNIGFRLQGELARFSQGLRLASTIFARFQTLTAVIANSIA